MPATDAIARDLSKHPGCPMRADGPMRALGAARGGLRGAELVSPDAGLPRKTPALPANRMPRGISIRQSPAYLFSPARTSTPQNLPAGLRPRFLSPRAPVPPSRRFLQNSCHRLNGNAQGRCNPHPAIEARRERPADPARAALQRRTFAPPLTHLPTHGKQRNFGICDGARLLRRPLASARCERYFSSRHKGLARLTGRWIGASIGLIVLDPALYQQKEN